MSKKITDFRPLPKNPNKHTLHGERLVEKSIQTDGFIDAQTSAANGTMISGSTRQNIAVEKFADVEPIVIHSDGRRPVIVVRDDIPDENDPRAKRLAVAANQAANTNYSPDGELLAEWGGEDEAIRAMFADSEWTEITGEEKPTKDAEPQVDRAQELLEKWHVKTGDLWQIGEHWLICGDCTDAAVVARVMDGEKAQFVFTDPPYGVKYTGGTKKWAMLENDDEVNMYAASLPLINEYTDEKAAVYLAFASANARSVYNSIYDAGYEQRALIIWNKNHAQFGAMGSQYKQKHEPVMYLFKKGTAPYWFGPNNEVTVWDIDRESVNEYHPTQKPPELYMRAMKNSAPEGCIVFEPFSGSGTALVACQNTGRIGRAIELDPKYVAVALERMSQAFPDLDIRRLE